MSKIRGAVAPSFAILVASLATSGAVRAQETLPDLVVTADRKPEPLSRTGSAISVVTREEIQTSNPGSLVDALRTVPGLDISEVGGPGAVTTVRLRGANAGQTLVLIDGIRVNDPASPSGEFDFSNLLPTAVDRIEVLRGPQSALYGSDAIGGVVNIITRQGSGPPRFEVRTEAGSYGTVNSSASATGSYGPWSYAFAGGGQRSDGFSRFGYRIGPLERKFGRFEADGFYRYGGYGRLGFDAGEGTKFEIGAMSFQSQSDFDAASSTLPRLLQATGPNRAFPDTPGSSERRLTQIFARATGDAGPLANTLTVFANQTDRTFDSTFYSRSTLPRDTTRTIDQFYSDRVGTEYQGDLKLGTFGSLIFGGKYEQERARAYNEGVLPVARARVGTLDAEQSTKAIFALYQLPIGERVVFTIGGRHDEVGRSDFDTWRATGAYLIPETGTKLRASGGTGGKAPTLFQLFDPTYGSPGLQPETSIGWDAGVDQTLFGGRATVSATYFANKFQDLIDFDFARPRGQNYFNVSRAKTSGVEVEAGVTLIPDWVKIKAAYTYLEAKDEITNLTLTRRPNHIGQIRIPITPIAGLTIEPRVIFVSERFSGANETLPLPQYARFDVYTEYKFNDTWRIFGRVENITDTRYQEVLNYGTTGRAAYAGFSVTW